MNRRTFLTQTVALAATPLRAADTSDSEQTAILRRIQAPSFPKKDFDITRYGA